jgi:PAS domain S-box-containing protein
MSDTLRVLAVDDEPALAELTATALQREDDRFEVTVARSAEAALDLLDGADSPTGDATDRSDRTGVAATIDAGGDDRGRRDDAGRARDRHTGDSTRPDAARHDRDGVRDRDRDRDPDSDRHAGTEPTATSRSGGDADGPTGPARFDCIVSDYDMPGMNGLEFLATVREAWPDLPFILYTGKGSEEVASEAISAGVTDYLQKATDASHYAVLANRVRNAVDQYRSERARRRFERAIEATNHAVYMTAADGTIEYVNPAFERTTGYAADEAVGRSAAFLAPDGADGAGTDSWVTAPPEDVTETEVRVRRRSGDHYTAHRTVVPIGASGDGAGGGPGSGADAGAEPVTDYVVIQRDITERKQRERDLSETNTVLRTLVENLPMGVLVEDADRNVLVANDRLCDLLDVPAAGEDLVGRDCVRAAAEIKATFAEPTGFIEGLDERVEGREATYNERLPLADDRVLERDYVPYSLPDGEANLWLYRDVTERRARERRLERQQLLFDRIQEIAAVGIWEYDPATDELTWSEGVRRIHGVDADYDPTVADALEFYHPEDRDEIRAAVEAAVDSGTPFDCELRIVDADGEVRHVRGWGNPIDEGGPAGYRLRGVFQDVTERKRRDRELRELTERLELAVEGANLGVWDWDMTTDAVTFNDNWATMLGYDPDEIDSSLDAWERRLHPEDEPRVRDTLAEHIAGETDYYDAEHRLRTADGDWKWIRDVGRVIERDEAGDPVRAVGIHIDVDDRKTAERELRQERNLFADGPTVVVRWAAATDRPVEYVSENVADLLGYAAADLVSGAVAFGDIVHEEDLPRVRRELAAGSEDGIDRFTHDPFRVVTADGDVRWVRAHTTNVRSDGELTHHHGYLVDITERKQRERQLQRLRERFERFAATVPNAFVLVSPDYAETHFVNDAVERIYGVPATTVETDPEAWLRHVHPDDVKRVRASVRRQSAGTADWPLEQEFRVRHPDRGLVHVHASVQPVRDEDGTVVELAAIATDVTDRKQHERELQRRREDLRRVVDLVPDPIFVKAQSGEYLLANEATADALGLSPEEIEGRTDPEVVPADNDVAGFQEDDRAVIESDEPTEVSETLTTADGETRIYQTTRIPYRTVESDEPAVLGYARDVTPLKRKEAELRRERDRLDEFASFVSHDLRNPINVAQGRTELARQACDSDHLAVVERSLDRMEQLITDLLLLARRGQTVGETERVDLEALATECWRTVETTDARLVVADPPPPSIRADRSRVETVLENLFRNAVDHGGPEVTVTVGALEDGAGFFVADDGPGIPPDDRSRVFETGYSTERSGTGFGLAIVEGIVEAHGWAITATDAADGGARFEVTGVDPIRE